MQDQIDDLQLRLSFQEELIEKLTEGFTKQQLVIDKLEHKMTVFERVLGDLDKAAANMEMSHHLTTRFLQNFGRRSLSETAVAREVAAECRLSLRY